MFDVLAAKHPEARAALQQLIEDSWKIRTSLVHGDYSPKNMLVRGDGWTLEAVATPGHTANHLAFSLLEENLLFSADHVMAWSTSVVAPA